MIESQVSKRRAVLIHYHIFKNAGSTIDFALENSFGKSFSLADGKQFNSVLDHNALIGFLNSHPSVRAISSHHLRLPSPADDRFRFYEIVILRHPIDRLLSAYDFYRRSPELQDPLQATAATCNFNTFIVFLINNFPHLVNNAQVNFLSCGGSKIPREPDLKRALKMLPEVSIIGTVELLNLALVFAEFFLGSVFGHVDFSYARQNVNPQRLPDLSKRLSRARELCGATQYERLLKLNKLDLTLFDAADQEVRKRYATVPHNEQQLASFFTRCGIQKKSQE